MRREAIDRCLLSSSPSSIRHRSLTRVRGNVMDFPLSTDAQKLQVTPLKLLTEIRRFPLDNRHRYAASRAEQHCHFRWARVRDERLIQHLLFFVAVERSLLPCRIVRVPLELVSIVAPDCPNPLAAVDFRSCTGDRRRRSLDPCHCPGSLPRRAPLVERHVRHG